MCTGLGTGNIAVIETAMGPNFQGAYCIRDRGWPLLGGEKDKLCIWGLCDCEQKFFDVLCFRQLIETSKPSPKEVIFFCHLGRTISSIDNIAVFLFCFLMKIRPEAMVYSMNIGMSACVCLQFSLSIM